MKYISNSLEKLTTSAYKEIAKKIAKQIKKEKEKIFLDKNLKINGF